MNSSPPPNDKAAGPETPAWAVKLIENALIESGKLTNLTDYYRYPMDAPRMIAAALLPYLTPPTPDAHGAVREKVQAIYVENQNLHCSTTISPKNGWDALERQTRLLKELLAELATPLGHARGDELRGKIVSAGDLTLMEDGEEVKATGVFIKCTREALMELRGNMMYRDVEVRAAMRTGGASGGAS